MALATRNLYLVLKARDEASRVIRGFGRELTRTGALAKADALRSQAAVAALTAAEMKMTGAAQADIDKQVLLSKTLRSQAQDIERHHRNVIRLTNALQSLSSTLVTVGSGFTILGAGILVALGHTIQVAIDYQKQVALTLTQVTDFKTSLLELGQIGLQVANHIAVPFEEIQPALYDIFSSTNANLKEAQILLEGFAKTAVAGQVSLQDATRGTIPILNAFNIPLQKVNDILDIQFQLVRKGVGTYGQFASVFGRVVPSATRANQSFQEVAAMLAYLTRNGLSAAMAASSSARALDALSNPKAVAAMEGLNIKVRDLKGNLLPLEDILSNLQKYLLSLPNKERVGALVGIFKGAGGTIQARRFLDQVLLRPGELDEFKGFLKDMEHAQGAFGQAYGVMADTVASKTQLLKNQLKVFEEFAGRTLMPIFQKILGVLASWFEKFNNLSPAQKKFIVEVLAIGGALTALAGIILVLLGLLAGLVAAMVSAGAAFFAVVGIIAAVVTAVIGLGAAFIYAWNNSKKFRDFIKDISQDLETLWKKYVVPTATSIRDSFVKYVLPALRELWGVITGQIVPSIVDFIKRIRDDLRPILDKLSGFIKTVFKPAFDAIGHVIHDIIVPEFEKLNKIYQDHKEDINKVVKIILIAVAAFLGLAAAVTALLLVIGTVAFAAAIGVVIVVFKTVSDTIHAVIQAVDFLIAKVEDFIGWLEKAYNSAKKLYDKVQDSLIVKSKYALGTPENPMPVQPNPPKGSTQSFKAPTRSANTNYGALIAGMSPFGSSNFHQSIIINTAKVTPIQTAAELGALMAGRF